MLSLEFIPTSPIEEEANDVTSLSTIAAPSINSKNITHLAPSIKPLTYSTTPESVQFIPQPPVQFFYSLQVLILCVLLVILLFIYPYFMIALNFYIEKFT